MIPNQNISTYLSIEYDRSTTLQDNYNVLNYTNPTKISIKPTDYIVLYQKYGDYTYYETYNIKNLLKDYTKTFIDTQRIELVLTSILIEDRPWSQKKT